MILYHFKMNGYHSSQDHNYQVKKNVQNLRLSSLDNSVTNLTT